jgi:inner membrane protein
MFVWGHVGLTLAAMKFIEKILSMKNKKTSSWYDYRFIILGSVLPDLIDKSIYFFFREMKTGRSFGHTLLSWCIILNLGLFIWAVFKKPVLVALAAGYLLHFLFDIMWLNPETLFWPILGFEFPRANRKSQYWLENFFGDAIVPEIAGAFFIMVFLVTLLFSGHIIKFIKEGRL